MIQNNYIENSDVNTVVNNDNADIEIQINKISKSSLKDTIKGVDNKNSTINEQFNLTQTNNHFSIFGKEFSNIIIAKVSLLSSLLLMLTYLFTNIFLYTNTKTFTSLVFAQVILFFVILFFVIFAIFLYKYIIELVDLRKTERKEEVAKAMKFYQEIDANR